MNTESPLIVKNPALAEVKKIGIVYSDVRREYFPTEEQYITEKEAEDDAKLVAKEIENLGIKAELFPGNEDLPEALKRSKPDMVFNLVDSVKGNEYLTSTIPGLLDIMDIPYTGAGLLGLALCYNKFLTLKLLRNAGIPVPNFQLFNSGNEPLDIELRFPLISKLNEVHGGVEITQLAVSENEKHLRERVRFLAETYNQPVIVEEFIAGREITILILEGFHKKTYMAEKVFNKPDEKYKFATFNDQWGDYTPDKSTWPYTYQKYEDGNLKELARKAFDVARLADYGKFDVRLDQSGRYYFIDSNANPAFGPKTLYTAMGLIIEEIYGVSFQDILVRLIKNTLFLPDSNGNGNGSSITSIDSGSDESGYLEADE